MPHYLFCQKDFALSLCTHFVLLTWWRIPCSFDIVLDFERSNGYQHDAAARCYGQTNLSWVGDDWVVTMGFTMGFSSSLGIYMIREIMKGIRIVKCYAWEAAMEEPCIKGCKAQLVDENFLPKKLDIMISSSKLERMFSMPLWMQEQIKKLRTRELTFLNLYFKLCPLTAELKTCRVFAETVHHEATLPWGIVKFFQLVFFTDSLMDAKKAATLWHFSMSFLGPLVSEVLGVDLCWSEFMFSNLNP